MKNTFRYWTLAAALLLSLPSQAAVVYKVTSLNLGSAGPISPNAINNSGQIAVNLISTDGHTHAGIFDTVTQQTIDLGILPGNTPSYLASQYPNSQAIAINNKGQVVGLSSDGVNQKVFVTDAVTHKMIDLSPYFGDLASARNINVIGINDSSQIYGDYISSNYPNGYMIDLVNQTVTADLNNFLGITSNNGVGIYLLAISTSENDTKMLFTVAAGWQLKFFDTKKSTQTDSLNMPAGTINIFLNKSGLVAGSSGTYNHPSVINTVSNQLTDFGTLPGLNNCTTQGLSNNGQVIGNCSGIVTRGFITDPKTNQMLDINNLLDPSFSGVINQLLGINDAGQILASGTGGYLLLTPENIQTYALSLAAVNNGNVSSNTGGINCGVVCSSTFNQGASITLTATPNAGFLFTNWTGACSGNTTSCTVTMDAAKTVGAVFTAIPQLTVNSVGTGTGIIMSTPAGIDCFEGSDCNSLFAQNTSVMLVPYPDINSNFTGWSGAGCSGKGVCTLTMDTAKNVVATFTHKPYTLNVAKQGNGNGTLTSAPAGINCGTVCRANFDYGSQVTLTATPQDKQTVFMGWSGDCSGMSTCIVTMNSAAHVKAQFINGYTLTVAQPTMGHINGDADGDLELNIPTNESEQIACGINTNGTDTRCQANFKSGAVVALRAIPLSGYQFKAWTGACIGKSTVCTVPMNSAKTVTATFVAKK